MFATLRPAHTRCPPHGEAAQRAAAEARIKQNIKKLTPVDRKSGENLWLIDMIAPFGGSEEAVKELREKVFMGKKVKSLQPAPGGGVAVVEW